MGSDEYAIKVGIPKDDAAAQITRCGLRGEPGFSVFCNTVSTEQNGAFLLSARPLPQRAIGLAPGGHRITSTALCARQAEVLFVDVAEMLRELS